MKIIIQRVKSSLVRVDGAIVSKINQGMNLLVCLEKGDSKEKVLEAAKKVLAYRIFADENQKMNKSILDIQGEILAVSQFTLSWDGKKGNRPSFDNSMTPSEASSLFDLFCEEMQKQAPVFKGVFGASMEVEIINDGPVTFSINF